MDIKNIEGFQISSQQRHLWLQRGNLPYCRCDVLLRGGLDKARLKGSIAKVVGRHEILHTVFATLPGMEVPIQVISEKQAFDYRELEGSGFPHRDPQACEKKFDFENGPLIKAVITRREPELHVLSLYLPAVCCDAASLNVIFKELGDAYQGILTEEEDEELVQYADFAEWQRELAEEPETEFWKKLPWLKPNQATLPIENPTPRDGDPEWERYCLNTGSALLEKIDTFCEARGFTREDYFLSCWQILLWRLHGNTPLPVARSFNLRDIDAFSASVGPYAISIPIFLPLDGSFRFEEVTRRAKAMREEYQRKQAYFDWSLIAQGHEIPPFLYGFEYDKWPKERRLGYLEMAMDMKSCRSGNFNLKLTVAAKPEAVELVFEFLPHLYSSNRIHDLAAGYAVLMEALENDGLPIDHVPILGKEEKRRLLRTWGCLEAALSHKLGLAGLFERQTMTTPDRPAVIFENLYLTYGTLDARAGRLARLLTAKGIQPGDMVSLVVDRGLELLIGLWAILKAGAAYIPMSPNQPRNRMRAILEESGAAIHLAGKESLDLLSDLGYEGLPIDDPSGDPAKLALAPKCSNLPAYVLYTSGTTGTPKGIVVSQNSVVNLSVALEKDLYPDHEQSLRVSMNAPLIFDASLKQLVQLFHGHSLVIIPEEIRPDGHALLAFIRRNYLNSLDLTPSQLRVLLQAGLAQEPLSIPKRVLLGGEALDQPTWTLLKSIAPDKFYNVYGPSECTDLTTMLPISAEEKPNIGRPLTNVRVFVMDTYLHPLPVGVPGELCIGGAGLAQGYYRTPGLTAAKFTPDPFTGKSGSRLFRGGDRARFLENGSLEFLGRQDRQVKLRGFRIELGEIEAVLSGHPGVRNTVVLMREDAPGDRRLVAYTIPTREGCARIDDQWRHLLPNGMSLVQQNKNETDYLFEEIFSKKTYVQYGIRLPEGGCFLDVGANIGMFSLFVMQFCANPSIYAFEPLAPIYETLLANIGLYGRGVKSFAFGLAAEEQTIDFTYYPRYSMMSGVAKFAKPDEEAAVVKRFLEKQAKAGSEEAAELRRHGDELLEGRFEGVVETCRLRRLSEVIQEESITHIDLLKVDVQRTELEVLRGLSAKDWPIIDQIVIEVHDELGGESENRLVRLSNLLRGHGFEVIHEQDALLQGTDRYNLYASRFGLTDKFTGLQQMAPIPEVVERARPVSADDLRRYAAAYLPDHMIPSTFVIMESFPLTANGKIDTRALPEPDQKSGSDGLRGTAETPVEELLVGIWSRVLSGPRPGTAENFFELGGHSLLGTQLIAKIRAAFQIEIPLRVIFEAPTIKELAREVEKIRIAGHRDNLPHIQPVPRTGSLPLSFAQERMWFLHQLDPDDPTYNTPVQISVKGALCPLTLERVLGEIIRRHEVLRTKFPAPDGTPSQVIHDPRPWPIQFSDYGAFPQAKRPSAVSRHLTMVSSQPFNLATGPLMRMHLLRLAEDDFAVCFDMHHIISDAWTKGILVREIAALYGAWIRDLPSPLPEPKIQYADFSSWQHQWFQDHVLEAQLSYWKKQLARVPVLDLPLDRTRPRERTSNGRNHFFQIPATVADRLRNLGPRENATLFMTLVGVFGAFLSKYSNQEDICIGTPIANRNYEGIENLIGFFVNTLVLRSDFSEAPGFLEILNRTRQTLLDAYAHQDLPFERIVEALHPVRRLSHTPLFQVFFDIQHAGTETLRLPGLTLEALASEHVTAKFDLSLTMVEGEGMLDGIFEYNTDLFDTATIARIASHFENLAAAIVADPKKPLPRLSLMEESERAAILFEWNRTRSDYPSQTLIQELLEERVGRAPDEIALVFKNTAGAKWALSYWEMNYLVNQLANHLRSLGVGPGDIVAICLEPSFERIVGVLATLKAGAAYLPLEASQPENRLRFMLADSRARLLLSLETSSLPFANDIERLNLDTDWPGISHASAASPTTRARPENLAYIIYTSGSTGQPKGVMISQRSLVNFTEAIATEYQITDTDYVPQFAAFSFDTAVEEIFPCLIRGGKLVLHEQGMLTSTEEFLRNSRDLGLTVLDLPTAYWHQMAADIAAKNLEIPKRLRLVIVGGERVLPRHLRQWHEHVGLHPHWLNSYGPTEATVVATVWSLNPAALSFSSMRETPIGKPIGNARTHVLDHCLQPVPIGVTGALYIGGQGLSRGYLNQPALTAEHYLPNPFQLEAGERIYRSGDLARYRQDGDLEFAGRADHQVKLRGFRVELGEVEAALSQHPRVTEVAVVTGEDRSGQLSLIAYVQENLDPIELDARRAGGDRSPQPLRSKALKTFLKKSLPRYMVPSTILVLASLPLTSSGKVDRRALPDPHENLDETDFVEPRNRTEAHLASTWAEVLQLERVSAAANFFDLGGHSLLATRVISKIRDMFSVALPIKTFFSAPTIAGLSELVEEALIQNKTALSSPILPRPRGEHPPLSFAQQRLWFLHQLEGPNSAYNMPAALRLVGNVDANALEKGLTELAHRHEILNTIFKDVDGRPVQIVLGERPPELVVIALAHLQEQAREAEIKRLTEADALFDFDLAKGPLLRVSLLKAQPKAYILLLNMHHIICDGWSMGIFVDELSALYQSRVSGIPATLEKPEAQYADFAAWQRQLLSGKTLETLMTYWREQLRDLPVLDIPADRARPPVLNFRGASLSTTLDPGVSQMLQSLSQKEDCSLFMTLVAAFQLLLARYSGQQDVVLGTPIAGRNRGQIEKMIGFFINTLVLRTDLSGDPSFRGLLGRVREVTLSAYDHQDLPFEKLVEELQPERDLSRNPLFEVFFNMVNLPSYEVDLPGLKLEPAGSTEMGSKFDITLYATEVAGNLRLHLRFNATLFNRDSMVEMLAQFEYLLGQIAQNPEESIDRYSICTPKSLVHLPDPALPLAPAWEGSIPNRFSQNAVRAPHRIALIDRKKFWTYKELDAISDRLSGLLGTRGIGREGIVAVHAYRGAGLVIAMLAILKADAAFVILDPDYPAPRLMDSLEVCKPKAWLRIENPESIGEDLNQFILSLEVCFKLVLAEDCNGFAEEADSCFGAKCVERYRSLPKASSPSTINNTNADGLAYVAFTSGTTGTPRAVAGTHRPLSHFLHWHGETHGLVPSDRFAMISGLAHDPLLRDVFTPLWLGATLCIPDTPTIHAADSLAHWMARQMVSVAHMTPSMGRLMLIATAIKTNWTESWQLRSLRYLFFGGDALSLEDVSRMKRIAPKARVANFYGTTETPQAMGVYPVGSVEPLDQEPSRDLDRNRQMVPLGKGIDGAQLLVLNRSGALAGIGELAEIHIRSPYLSKGYLHDERLTGKRFITNPYTGSERDRLYKTGDLGRYLAGGDLLIQGRSDRQVNIRGFRIELEEIEIMLKRDPEILEAVVIPQEGPAAETQLIAYIVPDRFGSEKGEDPTAEEIRAHLSTLLPRYMIPSSLVILETLPLTPNRKIDFHALPAPNWSEQRQDAVYYPPRTTTQEMLCEIWSEVLGLKRVGTQSNFFNLGGHSLLATQIVSRIRLRFSLEIPLRAIFEDPTVEDLARYIENTARQLQPEALPSLVPVARTENMPLSFAQQRLWFLDQLEKERNIYNMPYALNLDGPLCGTALEQGFLALTRGHEVLRAYFPSRDGQPVQRFQNNLSTRIAMVDLTCLPERDRHDLTRDLTRLEAGHIFDLARGPLVRVSLLRLSDTVHALMITLHHIICDGWSYEILIGDLTKNYFAALRGEPSSQPTLPFQYADFAHWQRSWLTGKVLEHQLAYWRKQLDGAPALLELPTDRPRPPIQSFRGHTYHFRIDPGLTGRLRDMSLDAGGTIFMTLLAAFKVLLSRYSRQQTVVVGTPIANRNYKECEALIGLFANTLALCSDLSGDPDFHELLRRVRETTLAAFANQDLPFERLVEDRQPERNLSHAPLFQIMFVLQNAPTRAVDLTHLSIRPIRREAGISKFDLTLTMVEFSGGLHGTFEYNSDLFDPLTIQRMESHFRMLLENSSADPAQSPFRIPLLGEEERALVLERWNETDADYPRTICLPQLFESQVERIPDSLAVYFECAGLGYRELNVRSNHLAHHLRGLGVGPDTIVAICIERSLNMIIAMMATLKAGAAYLPLDQNYPAERLAFMLSDSGAPVLISQSSLVSVIPANPVHRICIDLERDRLAREDDTNPRGGANPENLGFVIYTSGSTGRPKGVGMGQRPLVNLICWQLSQIPARAHVRTLQFSAFSFDASFQEVFSNWGSGGSLILIGERQRRDPFILLDVLCAHGVERLFLPFVALQQLADVVIKSSRPPRHLREIFTAGEQLHITPAIVAMMNAIPKCRLFNYYGPTETHVVTSLACTGPPEAWLSRAPIGYPIANTRVYLLDRYFQPVPTGVPGELFVGGEALARNYLNQPELTAQNFVPHPFTLLPGSRLYRTGDLARYLTGGKIEFLGRIDDQVKIRGFRIELGEVEAALSRYPGVVKTAVILVEEQPGQKQLIAYLQRRTHSQDKPGNSSLTELDIAELRTFLSLQLPDFMIPAAFVKLDDLPLTPSGKLDRRALPAPGSADFAAVAGFVATRTPTEEVLAEIWSEVLGISEIGTESNFFDLGGHSLLATRVISRVRAAFRVELTVRALFEAPTVVSLAEQIDRVRVRGQGRALPAIEPLPRNREFPLSFAQQRMWFLYQMEGPSAVYNISWAMRIEGDLDSQTLDRCIAEINHRHESVRTRFLTRNGRPVQQISASVASTLNTFDLRSLTKDHQAAETRRLVDSEAQFPFDLGTGPLLHSNLLRLENRCHVFLVTMHHIISDGWSISLMIHEMVTLYHAFLEGTPSPLPQTEIHYADFAYWQRRWLDGEVLAVQLEYWKLRLTGAPELLDLPTDRVRPAARSIRGARVRFHLGEHLVRELKTVGRKSRATLFMTLLAAFKALLARYSGQEDISVGAPIANRNRKEIEPLIGFFVNTLVLRTDLSGDPSFQELLGREQQICLDAYAQQDVPFERVVEAIQPERNINHNPLFQVMFVLQNTPIEEANLTGTALSPVGVERVTAKFDLTLSLEETAHGLSGYLEHNTDLFEETTARRMVDHYEELLTAVAADPAQSLSELPLLRQSARKKLLEAWNPSQGRQAPIPLVVRTLEAWVRRNPERTAVMSITPGNTPLPMSYQSLNRQANQVARYLQGLGIGPELPVGVCLERSADLIVSLLGILKAGGVYVPLDPSYPRDRLAFMLNDSGISVLITQGNLLEALPSFELNFINTLVWDEDRDLVTGEPGEDMETTPLPQNLAYMIYTSGSTGNPKGVQIHHLGLANLARAQIHVFEVRDDSRVLQFSSPSFDASISEIFISLCGGATLFLAVQDLLLPGPGLVRLLQDQSISHVTLPASVAALVPPAALPDLKTLILAGEACSPELVARWAPGRRFINAYGPTESTVCATAGECKDPGRKPPIGGPIDNLRIYILDRRLEPVPTGLPGELFIAGTGLARGYLNHPEKTAAAFLPDPFGVVRGDRIYRSGDLARYLPSREFEFLGRTDQQVKLRGFRIEIGEIEAAIQAYQGVDLAVVSCLKDGRDGNARLVAHVVCGAGISLTEKEIHTHLQASLPHFMVPEAVLFLEEIPLTPSGKLDRKALPNPEEMRRTEDSAREAPRTPFEEILVGIWTDVMSRESVGTHEDFFDLGGHSLMATQLISRISSTFKIEMPLQTLFESATIATLALRIEAMLQNEPTSRLPQILPARRGGQLPLSFAQEGIWFAHQLEKDLANYNTSMVHGIKGPLHVRAMEQALFELSRRHEVLRTSFPVRNEQPVQVIGPPRPLDLPIIDLSVLPAETRQGEAAQFVKTLDETPMNLETGYLFRPELLRLGEGDHIIHLLLHHIICDGWSRAILIRELTQLYEAYAMDVEPELPAPALQYADYAFWQRDWLREDVLAAHLKYWREQLAGYQKNFTIPTDRPYPKRVSRRGKYLSFPIPAALHQGLLRLGKGEGCTLFITMLAGFKALLARYSGVLDMCLGTVAGGRNRLETEGIVGLFINSLVLRTNLSGNPAFRNLLVRVREVTLGAFAHQELPFDKLVAELKPQRDAGNLPFFQIVFALQNVAAPQSQPSRMSIESFGEARETVNYDLTLWIRDTPAGLFGNFSFRGDLFDEETIRRMGGHYVNLLGHAVSDPEVPLEKLEYLTAEEKQSLTDKKRQRKQSRHQRFKATQPKAVRLKK